MSSTYKATYISHLFQNVIIPQSKIKIKGNIQLR